MENLFWMRGRTRRSEGHAGASARGYPRQDHLNNMQSCFFPSLYLAPVLEDHHVNTLDCSNHHEVAAFAADAVQKYRLLERQIAQVDFLESGTPRRHGAVSISTKRKTVRLSISVSKGNRITDNSFA